MDIVVDSQELQDRWERFHKDLSRLKDPDMGLVDAEGLATGSDGQLVVAATAISNAAESELLDEDESEKLVGIGEQVLALVLEILEEWPTKEEA